MDRVLETFQAIDLSHSAGDVLTLLDTSDPLFLGLILGLLTLLGAKMAAPYRSLVRWGLCVAGIVFLVRVGMAYVHRDQPQTEPFLAIAGRGLIFAAAVLVPLWIVLPVLAFAYTRLRLAVAAFLGYAGYECVSLGAVPFDNLAGLALRGLLATGLVLLLAWVLQPVLAVLRALVPSGLRRRAQDRPAPLPQPELSAPPTVETTVASVVSWKARPQEARAEDQRRRQRARLRAEVYYELHEAELGDRFSRERFEDLLERYLSDEHAPEDVEQDSKELESLLREHASGGLTRTDPALNLSELTRWLLHQQQRCRAQEVEEGRRRAELAELTHLYSQMAHRLLQQAEP